MKGLTLYSFNPYFYWIRSLIKEVINYYKGKTSNQGFNPYFYWIRSLIKEKTIENNAELSYLKVSILIFTGLDLL